MADELDDEGTDPGLDPPTEIAAEAAPLPPEEKTRVGPMPTPTVDVALEEGDPTASVVLPDEEALDDEAAAIEAALDALGEEEPVSHADEPSIQVAPELQADAERLEPNPPKPRVQVRPGASGVKPRGRRRKRGGVVGKK